MATFLLSKFRKRELDAEAQANIEMALAYSHWRELEEDYSASPGALPFMRTQAYDPIENGELPFGRQGLRPRPGSRLALAVS